jgi:hypothetical protein
MRLLVMLVPMLMIGCDGSSDGSRESFTLYYDADGDKCNVGSYMLGADERTLDCSCPTGFTRVGFTSSGVLGNNLEVVCLQD